MNRRKALLLIGGAGSFFATGNRSLACMWDTDTLSDEVATQADAFDLILGQFAHHGEAYYKLRIERILKQAKMSQNDLNDIAVAYVRINDFKSAEKYLAKAESNDANHYETLSNIGVTAKKQGDFAKGAKYIEKALAIKAEGHMGLRDYYLKSLQWRQKHERANAESPPVMNFLGHSYLMTFHKRMYATGKMNVYKDIHQSKEGMMIKNDQTYADGFMVFGDHLCMKQANHLGFLAHTRAMMLGHQNPEEIRRRRRAYLNYHGTFPGKYGKQPEAIKPWGKGIARAESMINKGAAWSDAFKATEAELLKSKTNEKEVTIKMVEARLLEKKIFKVKAI